MGNAGYWVCMSSLNEVDTHRRANKSKVHHPAKPDGGKVLVLACLSTTGREL
jgi:hypothetical protein